MPHALVALLAIQIASPASLEAGDAQVVPLPEAGPASAELAWRGTEGEMQRFARTAEEAAAKNDPLALAHLYRLWNMGRLLERPRRIATAMERIRAEKRVDPLVRDHAALLAARLFDSAGDRAAARDARATLGLITRGLVIGPFENAAGAGHDEVYPPELGAGFDDPIRGKGHLVAWRDSQDMAEHGVFELSHMLHPSREATAYVATIVQVPAATRAILRTGATDQLRVFVNGAEVYAIDTRRAASLDQDAIPIALARGPNLLLFKVSWTEDEGRLSARLSALNGEPLRGAVVRTEPHAVAELFRQVLASPAKVSATGRAPTVLDGVERALAKRKGAARAEALALRADLYAILDLYDRRKLPSPPERDLEEAIRLSPNDPFLRFFYAHRVRSRDSNLAHTELEAALVADPNHVPARLVLAEMAQNASRLLDARAHLDAARERDPAFVLAHVTRATLGFDGLQEGALAMWRLAQTPGIESSFSATLELARLRRTLGDPAGANQDVAHALELDHTSAQARTLAIGLALDAGDVEGALLHLEATIVAEPYLVSPRLKRVRTIAGIPERLEEALSELRGTAAAFPDSPAVPRAEAELLLRKNDEAGALVALDRALELDPHQPDLRSHRRALSGEGLELEDRFGVDAAAKASSPVSEDERKYGAIYLADHMAIRLYENGKSTKFRQSVMRLHNPRLRDALRAHRVHYSPSRETVEILTAERIRPSGEVQKATGIHDDGPRGKVAGMYVDQRFKVILFDDLDAGDVIHVRYRIDSLGQNIFGGFFGDIEALQSPVPKLDVAYTAISPAQVPLYAGVLRAPPPQRVAKDGNVELSWAWDRIAALEMEPMSPPYAAMGSLVSLSTYATWDDLGKWYARLYADQLELDAAAREAGRNVVRGAKTDDEKIRRLYDYVVKNTRYVGIELGIHGWKPFKASEVHRRRYGDCKDKSTLLAALLRDNGIEATITLVRTADRGGLPKDHATMWAFNHAITYVPSANLYLDPTAEFSGSRELPYQDQGAVALVVYPDGRTQLTTLPDSTPPDNLNESSYVTTVARSTELELEGTERFFGARASALRQDLEEVEQRKSILERQLAQTFPGAHIETIGFSDMSDLEQPVHYKYKAAVPRYGQLEGGRLIIPVTLYQHQVSRAYAGLATRKTSVWITHPWATRNVIRYVLPAGSKIVSLPEGVDVDSPHVSLSQKVTRTPDGFQTDDTVTLKSKEVPPEDYEAFREACLAIDRALGRKVVIEW